MTISISQNGDLLMKQQKTMTREELIKKRDEEINDMIDRFNLEEKCARPRDKIFSMALKGMILNNMAFTMADVANTLLLDCEKVMERIGIGFEQKDKQNFNEMLKHVRAARKWAEKSALPIYHIPDTDDACSESDWWYNFIKLVDDRIGDDPRKTYLLLEYILAMPSEVGIFNITFDDFKQFKNE